MRRTLVAGLFAVLALCWCSLAAGNPVVADLTMAMQMPESMHVQVSYFVSDNWTDGAKGPISVEKDGVALTVEWVESVVSFNGGSGIEGYDAFQSCDCDVEPGSHEYKLTFELGQEVYASQTPKVDVTDPPPAPQEPEAMPEGDVMLWDIPDGPWPKGLDCVQWCLDNPAMPVVEPADEDTGGSPGVEDASSAPAADAPAGGEPDSSGPENVAKDEEGSSSCAAGSSTPTLVAILLFAFLGIVLAGLRFSYQRKDG